MESNDLDLSDPAVVSVVIDVMQHNDHQRKRLYPKVFYVGGHWVGRVRPQYFPIALKSNDLGIRYVPDNVLDELIPEWREYMNGKLLPINSRTFDDAWLAWCARERQKYAVNRVPFPKPRSSSAPSNAHGGATTAPPQTEQTQGTGQFSTTTAQGSQSMEAVAVMMETLGRSNQQLARMVFQQGEQQLRLAQMLRDPRRRQ
ncbi:uncharacterized protein N7458_004658 [Penicillium daleae]|uniref:Uncharacterized protein n=1 Tax=Penicillium daleae TaxID=63821 RepID=A0AAD6G3M7_9EURO|nr:uncharacterized protein N7458_004658 [Penicillium daleae]KAJ5453702.1 hypothetical protein N7458_004658 [Penicillium daleae]